MAFHFFNEMPYKHYKKLRNNKSPSFNFILFLNSIK